MNRLALTKVILSNKNYIAYVLLDEQRKFVDFQLFEDERPVTDSKDLCFEKKQEKIPVNNKTLAVDFKHSFHTEDYAENKDILNNIYIARVENIVSNINAAFLKISPHKKCYLSLEDLKSPIFTKRLSKKNSLSIGDELIVQVIKDSIKTKDPVVSTKLTLSGTYCVLTTNNLTLSISKKIAGEKRASLQEILKEIQTQAKAHQFGIVIRTNATEVPKEAVFADVQQVIEQFIKLKSESIHKSAFSVLVKEKEAYIRKLKSLDLSALDGIYTDDTTIYETIQIELPYLKENTFLHFYEDKMVSLKALYNNLLK